MTHELSWPAANLRRCGWPHSPPFRHTLHFPDGVRLTPEQAEPRASREVHESTPLDSGIQAGLSGQGRRHDHHALLVCVRASHAAAVRAVD
jgi:hypothetical protein